MLQKRGLQHLLSSYIAYFQTPIGHLTVIVLLVIKKERLLYTYYIYGEKKLLLDQRTKPSSTTCALET